MSFKENVRNLFKSREIKEAEEIAKFQEACDQEKRVVAAYLKGEISHNQFKEVLEETRPVTQINFRRLASVLSKNN